MSSLGSHPSRHIVAMGGGVLLPDSGNLKLERYVCDLTGKPKPRVCFVGTAGGDDSSHLSRFYQTYTLLGAVPGHLPFFARTPADLRAFTFAFDALQIGGGNTRSMLAVWKHWGFDDVLREAYERGIVMCGSSAGSICWFDRGVTDSVAGSLGIVEGLGLLAGSNCPHYDSEKDRRPSFQRMVASGEIPDGIACDDGAGAHFVDGKLHAVVASRPQSRGYRVERDGSGGARETALDVTRL